MTAPPDNPFGGSGKYKVGVIYGEDIEKLQKVEMFRSTQRSSNPVIFTNLLTTRGKIVGNVEHKKKHGLNGHDKTLSQRNPVGTKISRVCRGGEYI